MVDNHVADNANRVARTVKLFLLGLAFVAAIGDINLGNFATNIQVGASFAYQLLGLRLLQEEIIAGVVTF